MPMTFGHLEPDMTLTRAELAAELEHAKNERAAVVALHDLEIELREQAQGSQDGWLLDIANRMKSALTVLA